MDKFIDAFDVQSPQSEYQNTSLMISEYWFK